MSDDPQDTEAKPIWQSRTIIGAFVTILALVAGFKNFKIDVANLTDILVQVAGLVGATGPMKRDVGLSRRASSPGRRCRL